MYLLLFSRKIENRSFIIVVYVEDTNIIETQSWRASKSYRLIKEIVWDEGT